MKFKKDTRKGVSKIIQEDFIKRNETATTELLENLEENYHSNFWSYHAGLADGDGSFLNRQKGMSYKLKLCDLAPVKSLADAYGASISKITFSQKKYTTVYFVTLYSDRADHFAAMVCPMLSEKRKLVTKLLNKKYKNYHPVKIPMNKDNIGLHLSYIAGFFDAEGSVKCSLKHKKKKYKNGYKYHPEIVTTVKMTNTELSVLKKIQQFLTSPPFNWTKNQLKIYSHLPKGKKLNGEPFKIKYDLHCNAGKGTTLMAILEPMIMIPRKKKSIKTLKLLHAVDKMVGHKTLANYPVNLKRELGPSQKVTI